MSIWAKIRGTIETIFQIGLGGPQVKNNASIIEFRNSGDSGFVIARGATPVGANDLATKAYVDSGGASGAVQEIRFPIALVNTASTTQLPANAQVSEATVEVTTPYSGGTTISVGQTGGSASLFQLTTDNLATANGLYQVEQDTTSSGTPATVSVTFAGSPAAGAGFVIVKFSETLP